MAGTHITVSYPCSDSDDQRDGRADTLNSAPSTSDPEAARWPRNLGDRDHTGSISRQRRLCRRPRAAPWWLHSLTTAVFPPLVALAVGLAVWYLLSHLFLRPDRRFLLPSPEAVFRVGFANPKNMGELLIGLERSAGVAFLGLVLATLLGITIAVFMSHARWLERSLFPYAVLLQTIPILAIAPLFGFWFGFGFFSRTLVCVLSAIFPIIANTMFGLRSASQELSDLFVLHHAGRWATLVKLQFPAALPAVINGLRVSGGLSVIGAIVGDFFFVQGQPGIGALIDIYRQRLQSEQLVAAVLLSSTLGVLVFWFFTLLGRVTVGHWYEPERGGR